MASDIVLEDNRVTLECGFLVSHGSDFMLESPGRRSNRKGYRRAMVHDPTDGLTLNWANDYPGGVTINDARPILHTIEYDGEKPKLPRYAKYGTLAFAVGTKNSPLGMEKTKSSLWICVPPELPGGSVLEAEGHAMWREVLLGDDLVLGSD
jgi:hypothetical protein